MLLKRICAAATVALVIRLLSPGAAGAQEGSPGCATPDNWIANCGFEAGDFSSWSTQDLSNPYLALAVYAAGGLKDFYAVAPTEGSFAASHGFDGNGPGTIAISQVVSTPFAGGELTFDYRVAWELVGWEATQPRTFSVAIRDAGKNLVVKIPILSIEPETNGDSGFVTRFVEIGAIDGGNSIGFEWEVPESFRGPAQFQLDNIRLRLFAAEGEVASGVSDVLDGIFGGSRDLCDPDQVSAGSVCIDRYEASVWRIPNPGTRNRRLVRKLKRGEATAEDLNASGAVQLGVGGDDYPCADNGQDCKEKIFAASIPGVTPSANITWFQAQAACANALKRLPSSAEWQQAAMGTPDKGADDGGADCNTNSAQDRVATGSRSACVSSLGAHDMVGNLTEWVEDWGPYPTDCPGWGEFSDDRMCLSGASTTETGPGARWRGGAFLDDTHSGALYVDSVHPSTSNPYAGFRCAR